MLTSTFVHIKGIGKDTEQNIWDSKIYNWHEFLENHSQVNIGSSKKQRMISSVKESVKRIQQKDYSYFLNSLPRSEHWRIYPELKERCCFLDIETTGLSKQYHDITLIGIYDGKEPKIFMNGKNLEDFQYELKKYKLLVTFNGSCFDLPFIKEHFPKVQFDHFHVDLRFVLANLGYRGGLKSIESQLGLKRDNSITNVDGFEAVRLWHRYKRGDNSALVKLTDYLKADISNLKPLMDFAFKEMKSKCFYDGRMK